MHVAEQLRVDDLTILIDQRAADLGELFPKSNHLDRFGIVVEEPFGSLGASLLIQAAIVGFYENKRARRVVAPAYPEMYIFHVGGRHGDHSSFDFWPPRKEVFLPGDPVAILAALNDRAITRLAIPDRAFPGHPTVFKDAPSTWAEQSSAYDRLASCWVYSPDGRVTDPNVHIASAAASYRENSASTLNPRGAVRAGEEQLSTDPASILVGNSVRADFDRWRAAVLQRADEVSAATRTTLQGRERVDSPLSQSYRTVTSTTALAILATCGDR